eukprot:TRINITY_DN1396_c0_g1_i5.p1 TRINITY_DN1396_c0_g1~~TRINITY_DN1396_c0_g1_i5.p1  ORF type:complete len:1958 (-),score=482.55 TRINITY_DN1396_c0_g1_i5:140-5680(-)
MARTSADPALLVGSLRLDGDGAKPNGWNLAVLGQAVRELQPNVDWARVFAAFDQPSFQVTSAHDLSQLLGACKALTGASLPLSTFLLTRWTNVAGQISLLKWILQAPADLFSFASGTQLSVDLPSMQQSLTQARAWRCADVYATLVGIADGASEFYAAVRALFDYPISHFPDVVFLGILSAKKPDSELSHDVSGASLASLLTLQATHTATLVVQQAWTTNQDFVLAAMVRAYQQDPVLVKRLLDLASDLRALPVIIERADSPMFVLDMASLAARRDFLNLEKWLADRFASAGNTFLGNCLQFLRERSAQSSKPSPALVPEILAVYLKFLGDHSRTMTPQQSEELALIETVVSQSASADSDESSQMPQQPAQSFSAEVEEEANMCFQKIYTGATSIADIISQLHMYRGSQIPREQEVFACVIHNLFDEYRFFPKYPEKELKTTGVLFGQLIHHRLVTGDWLLYALRCVSESLKKTQQSKMYRFGLYALEQFKDRLSEWPEYAAALLAATGQRRDSTQSAPEEGLETSTASAASVVSSSASDAAPASASASSAPKTPFGTTLNIDTLTESGWDVQMPDEATQDKVHFIINNVSQLNLEQKAKELMQFLQPSAVPWLANYLVVKRASIEPNFHAIYLSFLDLLTLPTLIPAILNATYKNIKKLLESEKIKTAASERALLKNLGSWLGNLTLARNQPILHRDIAFKELILDAYQTGRLIAVIPFVAKVFEACNKSKIFMPPNPWVMAIVRVLVELYHINELKLNLKFEIQVLCRNLSLDINDVKPGTYIADFGRVRHAEGSTDFGQNMASLPQQEVPDPSQITHPPVDIAATINVAALLANTLSMQSVPVPLQHQQMRRIIIASIERAVREIINPVVDRAVSISAVTTKELILKDFATEPDEGKMRKATHLMAQNLAGNLALVTCKEPMRVSITQHLQQMLQQSLPNESPASVELLVVAIVNDNLDEACKIIEKAATDQATQQLDELLAGHYSVRKRHRERAGQPFSYSAIVNEYPASFPEFLRPKPGGLTASQLRIYEDFGRPRPVLRMYSGPGGFDDGSAMGQQGLGGARVTDPFMFQLMQQQQQQQPAIVNQQVVEQKLLALFGEIDRQLLRTRPLTAPLIATIGTLPPDHDLHKVLASIPSVVQHSPVRQETAVFVGQQLLRRLYTPSTPLHVSVFFTLLEVLRDTPGINGDAVANDLTKWLLTASEEDSRKFLMTELTIQLIKAHLLSMADLSVLFAKTVIMSMHTRDATSNPQPALDPAVEFGASVVYQCAVEQPLQNLADISPLLEALGKVGKHPRTAPEVADALAKLLEMARLVSEGQSLAFIEEQLRRKGLLEEKDPSGYKNLVRSLFFEWKKIQTQPAQMEKICAAYVQQLLGQGLLKLKGDDQPTKRFFRTLMDLCVDEYHEAQNSPLRLAQAQSSVDAVAKLLLLLAKYYADPSVVKVAFLQRVISVIGQLLIRDHETRKAQFNQKPYHRLFGSLLLHLVTQDTMLDSFHFQFLQLMGTTLLSVNPLVCPAFAFAWLELISHRNFMPKLLLAKGQKGWPLYQQLLVSLLQFLEPFLRTADLNDSVRLLYKGTLRVLLVLLHDFPEFLCDYHLSLCDAIPTTCIQMRNLVLSAFPRNVRLPDPFTPNLKVDLLPEISQPPRVLSAFSPALLMSQLKTDIDTYLKTRSNPGVLADLPQRLCVRDTKTGAVKYNVPLINSLVLYVGMQGLSGGPQAQMTQSASMEVLQRLSESLDSEGRYLFLNAIANQLRYPNIHTHYFSCVLLFLFAEATSEQIKEQITRVLLERLIVNRPHPWGLLITFVELVRNARFNFWQHSWTRCAPEIERLFESVARSCVVRSS